MLNILGLDANDVKCGITYVGGGGGTAGFFKRMTALLINIETHTVESIEQVPH